MFARIKFRLEDACDFRDLSDKRDGSDRDKETTAGPIASLKSFVALSSLGGSGNG